LPKQRSPGIPARRSVLATGNLPAYPILLQPRRGAPRGLPRVRRLGRRRAVLGYRGFVQPYGSVPGGRGTLCGADPAIDSVRVHTRNLKSAPRLDPVRAACDGPAMQFGIFYEHQLPRPWQPDGEERRRGDGLGRAGLPAGLGIDSAGGVEPPFAEESPPPAPPGVFPAGCAARPRRIRLGHGIVLMPPGYNHPARVAERIAMLDLV